MRRRRCDGNGAARGPIATGPLARCRIVPQPSASEDQARHAAWVRRLRQLIAADPLWAGRDAAFREIKGVAARTVSQIAAELPEIGTVSAKAIGKLAGLAPLADDSGKRNGARHIRGGRGGVRSILFVVAEIVRRHNPDFAAFHQRLIAAGKPRMVVRIALAHKLLTRLNAKARDTRQHLNALANA